jgi:hypothetical protein
MTSFNLLLNFMNPSIYLLFPLRKAFSNNLGVCVDDLSNQT